MSMRLCKAMGIGEGIKAVNDSVDPLGANVGGLIRHEAWYQSFIIKGIGNGR